MTDQTIRTIEAILSRGERVELMTGPDGEIRVLRVRRETIPTGKTQKPPRKGTA